MTKPVRGEIWLTRFWPSVGVEIAKERPAVILNVPGIGRLPLSIVVPITAWKPECEDRQWFVRLDPSKENGLSKPSGADTFQIKSLATERLITRLGVLPKETVAEIAATVAVCIGCAL
jgi:mRNA interferase MazF